LKVKHVRSTGTTNKIRMWRWIAEVIKYSRALCPGRKRKNY